MKTLTKKQQLLLLAGLIVFSLIWYFRYNKSKIEESGFEMKDYSSEERTKLTAFTTKYNNAIADYTSKKTNAENIRKEQVNHPKYVKLAEDADAAEATAAAAKDVSEKAKVELENYQSFLTEKYQSINDLAKKTELKKQADTSSKNKKLGIVFLIILIIALVLSYFIWKKKQKQNS